MTGRARLIALGAGLLGLIFVAALAAWQLGPVRFGQTLPARVTDHYETYDGWQLACDTAKDLSDPNCYLQYVDPYRPRPDFAAALVLLQMKDGKPELMFGIEPGLKFTEARIEMETSNGRVPLDFSDCRKNSCTFSGQAANDLLDRLKTGQTLHLQLAEKDGPVNLSWPLQSMTQMLDDFAVERQKRGLP